MDLETVVSAMIQQGVTAADFAVTLGVVNGSFVQGVFHHLLVNETYPSTPSEWNEEDADAIMELLKSPASSDFEPWSPAFEDAVLHIKMPFFNEKMMRLRL